MRFLILYVSNDRWHNRRTHAERPITLLPRELVPFFARPSRRIRFDGGNCLGQSHDWWELDQEMSVILHTADGMDENPVLLANARGVGPYLRLKIRGNGFAPILGAEHDMNYVLSVGVGHVSHLRRLPFYTRSIRLNPEKRRRRDTS